MWLLALAIAVVGWVVLSNRINKLERQLLETRQRLAEETDMRRKQALEGSLSMFTEWHFPDTSKGDTRIVVEPSALRLYGGRSQEQPAGRPRISIFAHEDEAGIIIRDEAGRERLSLGVGDNSFVQLLNEDGDVEWGFPMDVDEDQVILESLDDSPRVRR